VDIQFSSIVISQWSFFSCKIYIWGRIFWFCSSWSGPKQYLWSMEDWW